MESGEWTKTEALVLESAVEAIALKLKEQGQTLGSEPLSIIAQIRRLKFDHQSDISGGHRDVYNVHFELGSNSRERTIVFVTLFCHRRRGGHCQQGHHWVTRMVEIDHVDVSYRVGEAWEFESQVGKPLYRTSFEFTD